MQLIWSKTRPHHIVFVEDVMSAEKTKFLEVGCRDGTRLIDVARHGHDVYGIDEPESLIEKAKKKHALVGVDSTLVVASPENIPFDSNAFDAVFSEYYIENYDLDKALKEISRVLRPGGLAYIVLGWKTEDARSGELLEENFSMGELMRFINKYGFQVVYQDENEELVRKKVPAVRHKSVRFLLKRE